MYTKSIIQQQAELINAKNNFKQSLINLTEKYNIEDSIFIYNGKDTQEICEGYFEVLSDYDSLEKAISECNINIQGIRVINNSYQVGNIHKFLNECDNSNKILDIDRLKYINE